MPAKEPVKEWLAGVDADLIERLYRICDSLSRKCGATEHERSARR